MLYNKLGHSRTRFPFIGHTAILCCDVKMTSELYHAKSQDARYGFIYFVYLPLLTPPVSAAKFSDQRQIHDPQTCFSQFHRETVMSLVYWALYFEERCWTS